MVRLVVRRPKLTLLLLRAAWRFRARNWYRRPPFLPLPPRKYLDWRFHTAYGDEAYLPEPGEVERYLRWSFQVLRRDARRGARITKEVRG